MAHPTFNDSVLINFAPLGIEELDLPAPRKRPYFLTLNGFTKLLSNPRNLPNLKKLTVKNTAFGRALKTAIQSKRPGLQIVF